MAKNPWTAHVTRWIERPDLFVREVFSATPDPWQDEILRAFPTEPYLAMCAAKGPGKSTVLAWLCWNFLLTRPHPNIAATSISGDNLRDGLWKELSYWRGKSKLIEAQFEVTAKRIFRKGMENTWFLTARTWPHSGDPKSQADTLAGLHAPYIMFILDESGGIPESVMVSAEAALSNCEEGHIIQAGNPTMSEGPLYRAARNRKNGPDASGNKQWYVVNINGDPDDPLRSPRMDLEWCRQQIRNWGRDNAWVRVNVLGQFPVGSISSLISEDEVRDSMRRFYRPYEIGIAARIMGVDVARQGMDSSVIACREGIQMHNMQRFRNIDNNQGASVTNRIWTEFEADACFIDATGGFGFGWIDALKLVGKTAIPVQFASTKIANPERYYNKRAEMYFLLVEWIRNGGALPPEESPGGRELMEVLTQTQYFHHNDRLQLEEKEQIKDRLSNASVDEADACALTFAEPVSPKQRQRGRAAPNMSAVGLYSPFAEMDRHRDTSYGTRNAAGTNYNPFARR